MLDEMSSMELIEWAAWYQIRAWEVEHKRSATDLYIPSEERD